MILLTMIKYYWYEFDSTFIGMNFYFEDAGRT